MKKIKLLLIFPLFLTSVMTLMSVNDSSRNINSKSVKAVENDLNMKRDITRGVVIHNDASTLSGSRYRYLESYNEDQLARGFAHYYVAKGDIYRFWDDSKVAWHTANFSGNTEYIGVEVTNSMGAEATFLENEQETFKLVAKLLIKYGLEPNRETIKLHKEFFNTACPHRSWSLHGGSVNSVKDYFISQVKKYIASTVPDYRYQIGQSVQLVPTASLAMDNSAITAAHRRQVGVVVSRSVKQHVLNNQYYESYTVKLSDGTVKSYVYFDLQPSSEASYPYKIGEQVQLKQSAVYALDYSRISNADKQLIGTILDRGMMLHGNGNYYTSYTVKLSNGKIQNYVTFDLYKSSESNYPYKIGETVQLLPSAVYAVDMSRITTADKQKTGIITNRGMMLHGNGNYYESYTVQWSTGESKNYVNFDLTNKITAAKPIISPNATPSVNYTTHVENIGWQPFVKNGQLSGTSGQALRLEGIKINLSDLPASGDVSYSTHVQDIGWQTPVSNNQLSGTSGQSLRLEAINIKLTGEIAKQYDVYYRVHIENKGWLGWASNGQNAGSSGKSLRLEAIEIKLVKKGIVIPSQTTAYLE